MDMGDTDASNGEGLQQSGRTVIPGDAPISVSADDLLGRQAAAEVLAAEIRLVDASEGYVVGVLGPWGSGKTSLVNLTRTELARDHPAIPVLEFNPWMFSGAEQLVEAFFRELAAQLRLRTEHLANVADGLDAYVEVVAPLRYLPVVGPWIERARGGTKALKALSERHRGGIGTARAKVVKALRELELPIVVVLDDIDRLRTDEIRDVFKLVRLTANFPNIIYVVVFDRVRVEQALGEDGLPGRDYLEKILQLAYDVPAFPEHVLTSAMTKELDRVLGHVQPTGPWQEKRWPDVFAEVVRPLVKNMRDVRRYVAAVHATATGVGEHVAIVDVLGLEAVRVFLPDVFGRVVHAQAGLTTPFSRTGGQSYDPPGLKESVMTIVEAAGAQSELARSLIKLLFPAGQRHIENKSYGPEWLKTWLRDRRVAHADILSFYLERVAGSGLRAFLYAEQAFALLGSPQEFDELLGSVPETEIARVIERLEVYEGDYLPNVVEPAIVVLLNRMPTLKDDGGGRYTFGPRFVVTRVVLRMLNSCTDCTSREQAVRSALPQLTTLTAKRELLRIVGYEENSGHELIPREAAEELNSQLRTEIRSASTSRLAQEAELLRLLLWLKHSTPSTEPEYQIPVGGGLELALLLDSTTSRRVQPMGSRAVSTSEVLDWDALVDAIGGPDLVPEFLQRARASSEPSGDRTNAVLDLADRYAGGWRPPHF